MSQMFEGALTVTSPIQVHDNRTVSGGGGFGPASDATTGPGAHENNAAVFERSDSPRGLAILSITVDVNSDGIGGWFNGKQEVYYVSVAFDLSGDEPFVSPPKEVAAKALIRVTTGQKYEFTLGSGAPIYPPKVVVGGLLVYVVMMESDAGAAHVGEVIKKVHEDLASEGSLLDRVKDLIKNPGKVVADELLSAGAAALQPLGTILSNNEDEHLGLFQGLFDAQGSWEGKLSQSGGGVTMSLAELD